MRIRSTMIRLAIPMVAVGMVVTGCSSSATEGGTAALGTTNAINPHPVSDLKDGGNLRLAITSFPSSFNTLHVDGNVQDTADVVTPTLPSAFNSNAAGELSVNHDYFSDIQLSSTNPQVVPYTINPKAVWTDGSPITWEDLKSQWQSSNGTNNDYQSASTSGYDHIGKVERGVDDRQAVVTFSQPFGEWQGVFGQIYPKAATESPAAFNDWARNSLPVSSGPFVITNIDRTQNRITLSRNPKWWGDTPKLDNITFSVLDYTAIVPAIQNNELDESYVSGLEAVTGAKQAPNVEIRRAAEPTYGFIAFNGAPGSVFSDQKLRVAIAKAIDRQTIVNTGQHGIVDNPKTVNNHVYIDGQKGYQDNSQDMAFNLDQAAKDLDALGWVLKGDVREKDGKQLAIRDVMYQQDSWVDTAKIIQADLKKIGVKLDIQTVPGTGLFTNVIDPGNYDLAQWSRGTSVLPIGALKQYYYYDPNNWQSHKSRIGSPELNAVIDQAMAELDPAKAIELANKADKMIWDEGHSMLFNQASGTHAVRTNLANWGAFGLATADYTKVGFLK
ncbi:ABC transporter family substrate-binding protein [Nocardia seriolae]|uniref:ABC transporter family substrate-binding protein n=1 Tax=Nocardia seriolae TaxID=37332 RepID=UPI0012BC271A|nr:ABC transporter family substrate-binding protein [Nocardia seriolae]MTJ60113.1 ABC transporter family substrate-binding protein [Nocardia seriolae]MTJ74383.1 ABC transporter family substrate-binding protein [Nocardia seriolae]MTJ85113.1 ABC transporter family substrate-binding protein [Nocardia seriolae]MTK29106.1 ABC transporter family substrate-binding protein [Nocardia seriolae]MTK38042.1 ABC transporter family substrate-binding protein [Nocardia seriolae]